MAVVSKSLSLLALLPALALASPVKRAVTAFDVLNYALTLEHLEDTFYRQGLANFSATAFATAGYDATVYDEISAIARDEANHVSFLTSAISAAGGTPAQECTYSFPYTDVTSFLSLATVLEGVGVSAYLGAAPDIGSTPYLTPAGTILTIEARHNAILRALQKESPFPAPYDTPVPYNQVYTLAAQFIVNCPTNNPGLPFQASPKLQASSATIAPGATIDFSTPGTALVPVGNGTVPLYAAWFQPTGPVFSNVTEVASGYETTVPAGILSGQSYVVLTNCHDRVGPDTVLAGPALLEVTSA